jgi:hypothetical protein
MDYEREILDIAERQQCADEVTRRDDEMGLYD